MDRSKPATGLPPDRTRIDNGRKPVNRRPREARTMANTFGRAACARGCGGRDWQDLVARIRRSQSLCLHAFRTDFALVTNAPALSCLRLRRAIFQPSWVF